MDKVISMQDAVIEDSHPEQCEVCGWRDCNGHGVSSESGDKDTGIRTQVELEAELNNMAVFLEETKGELVRVTQELLEGNKEYEALEDESQKVKDKLMQVQSYALQKCQESDQMRMMLSAYQKQRNA